MDRKTYDFTKKAARTAYEEAIRTGDGGGSVEHHRHPDYSQIDHHHNETYQPLGDYAESKHYHPELPQIGHQHDNAYAQKDHEHTYNFAPVVILTQDEFDALENKSESTLYVVM